MSVRILVGDCRERLKELPDQSVQCCVTSPPYWGLRDYDVEGQIGLEADVDTWLDELVKVFREVRRVLKDDGTLWLNLGDAYATKGTRMGNSGDEVRGSNGTKKGYRPIPTGFKSKDLMMLPAMAALALRADGWFLRSRIIWHKLNPMPESVTDRPTTTHEDLFLFAKKPRYYYNGDSIREPASETTHARVSQDVAAQIGSLRANGGGGAANDR